MPRREATRGINFRLRSEDKDVSESSMDESDSGVIAPTYLDGESDESYAEKAERAGRTKKRAREDMEESDAKLERKVATRASKRQRVSPEPIRPRRLPSLVAPQTISTSRPMRHAQRKPDKAFVHYRDDARSSVDDMGESEDDEDGEEDEEKDDYEEGVPRATKRSSERNRSGGFVTAPQRMSGRVARRSQRLNQEPW